MIHPFPSALDGIVCLVVALVAGGTAADAALAGAAMLLLQFGIGATNDVVDAPHDSAKPGKPIPAGVVSRPGGAVVAIGAFVGGVAIAGFVDPSLAIVAFFVIAIGLTYDLALKGTAWSWLPFSVGIPILPIFGWLASSRPLPVSFAVLVPAAIATGAALSIGNALADLERDRATGVSSVATRLGASTASFVQVVLFGAVAVAAVAGTTAVDAAPGVSAVIGVAALVPVVTALAARGRSPEARERAWEVESIASGVLAIGWILAAAA